MDAAWKNEQNKKKDHQNRTKIDQVFVLWEVDRWVSLRSRKQRGFTESHRQQKIVTVSRLTHGPAAKNETVGGAAEGASGLCRYSL